jgi:homotetrameric cytidine deaminase
MEPDTDLADAARAAREHAYVPYSSFAMGAAVRTDTGDVVPGAVIENVSLGLAMCAERVALFGAVARGGRPAALALVAPRTDDAVTLPCGACLQVALELGGPGVVVEAVATDGEQVRTTVGELLPRGPRKAKAGAR